MKISTFVGGAMIAAAMATSASAGVYTETNDTPGYFDASADGRDVTFAAGGAITDLNIQVHFSKCDGQFFNPAGVGGCQAGGTPFFNELSFTLIGPDGTQVTLVPPQFFSSGSVGNEFTILFDSESANTLGGTPASGTFAPTSSLTAFNGKTLAGLWTLAISDDTGADALSFYDYTITAVTDDVPEPAMLGLFGLGALGLGLSRRRKTA